MLDHYAQTIVAMDLDPIALLAALGYMTMLFSNVMSHTAITTIMVPLGMAILPQHRTLAALVIALSSSTALLLPVSTPPNAIAYATGMLDQKYFQIGGLLIGVIGPLVSLLWVLLLS